MVCSLHYALCHCTWARYWLNDFAISLSGPLEAGYIVTYISAAVFPMMSDGIVFLAFVFLSALWFGRPPQTIGITTFSPSSHRRAGRKTIYIGWVFWTLAYVGIISLLSLQCPICQFTDKAQMFLTCQFWCQQLCFICGQSPCRASDKAQMVEWTSLSSLKFRSIYFICEQGMFFLWL